VTFPDLQSLLAAARAAAFAASPILLDYFRSISEVQISSKSSGVDLVSVADIEAENAIRPILHRAFADAAFIGEESVQNSQHRTDYSWIVDPLDGTSNFLAGLPLWAISIALVDSDWQPLAGVVMAPALGDAYEAVAGGGCSCNGASCSVRASPPGGGYENAMLATGFPYSVTGAAADTNLDNFIHMQRRFHKIRRLGSAALDLAYVADGVFDGMWELSLQPWDSAAGMLLVTEAGGHISRFDASSYTPGDPDLLAAATPELLALLQSELAAAAQAAT
jgi:myo-inositol-1(or 4)-monophosphatase